MKMEEAVKKIVDKTVQRVMYVQNELLETFLKEFCVINNVEDIGISSVLHVVAERSDNAIRVTELRNSEKTLFGIRFRLNEASAEEPFSFEVFGEITTELEKWKETSKCIATIGAKVVS